MEPRIQYARTTDGVSIAFMTVGEGPAVLEVPTVTSLSDLELQPPQIRAFWELLSRNRMFVGYDGRGMGMSDREARDFSLDARMRDLEAVVDRLGLERFAVFATGLAGPAAIAYAASRPERVSHLILWCSWAGGWPISKVPWVQPVLDLAERDWVLYTETFTHVMVGWSEGQLAHDAAAAMRASMSREAATAAIRTLLEDDVRHLLQLVRAPALVFHRRDGMMPLDFSQELATGIPNARMLVLEGSSFAPVVGDVAAVVTAIDDFLSEGEESTAPQPTGMTAILFADIADSTALTERMGDAAFREKARALDGALRGVIRGNGGTPVEGRLLGDGVLAVFTSARQAIEAALACGAAGASAGMPLHLGLHAGDVIREEGNVYGGAVNIAARISALSPPGEVLVSGTVRSLARTSAGVSFEDRGERELKGVGEPVRVWVVREAA